MNSNWQAFLTQQGAQIDINTVTGFSGTGHPPSPLDQDIICDLSHFSLFRARGEDIRDFLQGQLSNDIRLVDAEHSQLSSYNSPKGRMLAIFRLFQSDEDLLIQMPSEISAQTIKRLSMYIMRSRVTLTDISDELVRIGVSGPNIGPSLEQQLGNLPANSDDVVIAGNLTVMRIAGPQPRYEIVGPADEMQTLWRTLAQNTAPVGADAWALLDIHAGIPNVYASTIETFVPQMANLQLINGVNFKKGCYPGQEIVARMQYLGKLKRRMYLAHVDAEICPEPGTELYSEASASGQGTGKVVDARPNPEGGCDLLAIGEISSIEEGTVQLVDANGPPLRFSKLPYHFEAI